jgi:hypothetical protein
MEQSIAEIDVRHASLGWRWRTVAQALIPSASLPSLADAVSDSGQLHHPLVIVSFESPVATRMLAYFQCAPAHVSSRVDGLLPISYRGRLKDAVVAAIVHAPASSSCYDAAVNIASYVSKPYIRRSIQRLLAVDHVARCFREMIMHIPIRQIIVSYQSFLEREAVGAHYTGPRVRCLAWPPEAQKLLVLKLAAAGMPLGASVGDFTHLLCVVCVHDTKAADASLDNPDLGVLLFGLLPADHLPLGPSPDELILNRAPSPEAPPISADSEAPPISADSEAPPISADSVRSAAVSACDPQSFSGTFCRAQYKLHEAMESLRDATLVDALESGDALAALRDMSRSRAAAKTAWRAIDVGAAPGGWTAYLAGPDVGCSKVMAVDAASLAPAVLDFPSVCHVRSSLQDALLTGALVENAPYDLLVADLNADPRDCARWISPLFPLMKSGSSLVLTMKLPYATVDSEVINGQPIIQDAAELLSFGWTSFHCKWLMANTVKERTLFAVRRERAVASPPPQDSARSDVFNVRRSHQYRKARALQRQAAAQSALFCHEDNCSSNV